ncbi:MAG: DNA mismatch repair protein MutS [Christensenellaceae bacterium]|nr:DNA mismatch repair protein MutS [Christensenellaceae bacterium]
MALSPMMQQYMEIKQNYKDCLVFCRLGDFYELFFDDALIASKELELTLTGRNCGLEEKAPMCGVPYHAAEGYIAKLIEKGHKVAILEQLSEPAPGRLVDRQVVRVITAGTVTDAGMLDDKKNNYIASIYLGDKGAGIAYADVATGEFCVNSYQEEFLTNLNDTLTRIRPAEIICSKRVLEQIAEIPCVKANIMPRFEEYPEVFFDYKNATEIIKRQLKIATLTGFDFAKLEYAICASGALINYILETQKRDLNHINRIICEKNDSYLYLDPATTRNLELVETIREQKKKGSLLGLLDNTKTNMGARLLRTWILQPLRDPEQINRRLEAEEELIGEHILFNDITASLSKVSDISRIAGKISFNTVMPRDLILLKNSIKEAMELSVLVKNLKSETLNGLISDFYKLKEVFEEIEKAIDEEPPLVLTNGGYIKKGFSGDLDNLRATTTDAQQWLAALEATEREQTGIKNIKVGYTRVFGYYLEVPKSQQDQVPYRYQRKQTVVGAERYVTEELKQIEEKIMNSEELSLKLEQQLYSELKEFLKTAVTALQKTAGDIAMLDCICALAETAKTRGFIKPVINGGIKAINITDGRHPVVEALLKDEQFVPNDCYLDCDKNRTMIITGPNMAGKSTYMRQVALIVLLAHMGSFVPAKSAEISLTDRIFTRIGASDDLAYGQSTFMVEMVEVSNILNNATKNSLLVLDEVGRGTSTFDGLSIAWAVIEHVTKNIKAKTLFATHYHELTELEGQLEGTNNYRVAIQEFNNSIIFLHKIVRGGTSRSFGIEVASLAGIGSNIIGRAKQILHTLEQNDLEGSSKLVTLEKSKEPKGELTGKLKNLDMNTVTPLVAFDILKELSDKAKRSD